VLIGLASNARKEKFIMYNSQGDIVIAPLATLVREEYEVRTDNNAVKKQAIEILFLLSIYIL
jgi:hypothetical protein